MSFELLYINSYDTIVNIYVFTIVITIVIYKLNIYNCKNICLYKYKNICFHFCINKCIHICYYKMYNLEI